MKTPNPKSKIPNKSQIENPHQKRSAPTEVGGYEVAVVRCRAATPRPIGIWNLGFVWRLGFGIWSFCNASAFGADLATPAITSEVSFDFISALFVFMLATFVGLDVIRRVSRLLHTPLMSLTNAISAIAVVGAILVAGPDHPGIIHWLGLAAVVASVTNIVSGFLITDRMLKMFKRKEEICPR